MADSKEMELSGTDKLEGALSVASIQAGLDFANDRQWSTFCEVTRAELQDRGIQIIGRRNND